MDFLLFFFIRPSACLSAGVFLLFRLIGVCFDRLRGRRLFFFSLLSNNNKAIELTKENGDTRFGNFSIWLPLLLKIIFWFGQRTKYLMHAKRRDMHDERRLPCKCIPSMAAEKCNTKRRIYVVSTERNGYYRYCLAYTTTSGRIGILGSLIWLWCRSDCPLFLFFDRNRTYTEASAAVRSSTPLLASEDGQTRGTQDANDHANHVLWQEEDETRVLV